MKKWKRRGTRAGKQRNFASANGFLEFLICLGDRYNRHYYSRRRRERGIRGNERENGRGRRREKEREGSQSKYLISYIFFNDIIIKIFRTQNK